MNAGEPAVWCRLGRRTYVLHADCAELAVMPNHPRHTWRDQFIAWAAEHDRTLRHHQSPATTETPMTVNHDPAKPSTPTSHDIGWNAGYSGDSYPPERETDIAFARGYAAGLIARVQDNAEAAR